MKTKTILKTLAVALLMPAMLLTTACSSDDNIIDSEKSANTKGYALPVTVNVTRQGDEGTRATYTDNGNGTGSLAFSTGDKLFVQADNSPAGKFAGLLDYDSEKGKFSGTIMTQNAYSGTAGALLAAASSPSAALLPVGYGNYNYFTIYGEGTYNAFLSTAMNKTFALTKKDAVEQFSHETATSYSSGFALAPKNGIASFTISGLTASTEVTVVFSDGFNSITKNVMTNASGVATFAVGMYDEANINGYSLTVDDNNITMPTKTVEAGHIYNISRSVAATPVVPDGAISGQFTVNGDGDKVYFSKGNLRYNPNATPKWYFADNQWDRIVTSSGTATGYPMDLFTWGNINNPTFDGQTYVEGTDDLSVNGSTDWGSNIGSGWRTLSKDEWTYVLGTNSGDKRSGATVGETSNAYYTKATINTNSTSVNGVILFPDGATFAADDATWGYVNGIAGWTTQCTTDQWTALEDKGCVFLPVAGYREGSSVSAVGSEGDYWTSTADGMVYAKIMFFTYNTVKADGRNYRNKAFSVRLVHDAN